MSDDQPNLTPDRPLDRFDNWYGFDTENDETGKVTLAALIHESGEKWIWHRAGEFVKWCDKSKGKPVVICHNLEYDLVNEFGELYPYMQLNYLKGRLISAKYGNVSFLDSINHFRMSLKALGDSLGMTKLEMDIYNEDYVTQDAWICLKAMTGARDFIASLGGRIGATSGSSAVSVWRYLTDDEYLCGPLDGPWFRRGYYGGRTELFRTRAEGNIRGYDVNSMYPFVMLNDFPEYGMEDTKLEKAKGMGEVTISIPHDLFVAPLVYRMEGQRLTYPVGVVRGVWTYDEIRYAEKLGAKIHKVHKALGCNSVVRPFDDYINILYARRKESKSNSERLFLKVLMNSLYGKIASKNEVTRTVSKHTLLTKKSRRMGQVKWINHQRGLLTYTTPPQPYVHMIWGSMITAYSRLLLTRYLSKVPPEQLIYCDTDSIYCQNYCFDESRELGGLKLEKQANLIEVHQPKTYRLDDEYIAKGVPRPRYDESGKIVIDFAKQFIEDGCTSFQAPIRFNASINSKRGVANQWVTMTKSRQTEYKSKILSKGRYYPPVIGQQLDLFKAV